jgi:hypothetical protein
MTEDEVQEEARTLAREAGFNPEEIAPCGEPQPVVYDRGDGVAVTMLKRPLCPRWTPFITAARRRLEDREQAGGAA